MLKKILTYVALIGLLCYAAITAVWANQQAQQQKCTGIDIVIEQLDGAQQQFVSNAGVKADLGEFAKNFANYRIKDIDINAIEQKMRRNNNYETAECALTPDGRLRVRIVPMIPEARIITASGNGYYINRHGKRIDARPDFHLDVPVVSGNFNKDFTAADVLPVVRYVRDNEQLKQLVSMIYARDASNIYLVPRIKGHVICLGDTSRLDEKISNLMLMYSKVMPYKGWETYDTISLKFKGQVVATRSNKTQLHIPENFDEDEETDEASLQSANPEATDVTPVTPTSNTPQE